MEINDTPIQFQRYFLSTLHAGSIACAELTRLSGIPLESWVEFITNKANEKVCLLSDEEVTKQISDLLINKDKQNQPSEDETNRPTN